ncbi:TetR/AcrR family transcriptional regulator [Paenibacillus kobensis]|uniref:TetR/AcrR family transcriptional regulator n=1 Tax=Paenibacillus kobensis TaxID=59841 RepID=UPI000FDA62DD|nr:TetR/AcrR family transcriptional regulator [Paenibacillus kobensis]
MNTTADQPATKTSKSKKTYDAVRTKEMILDAAEELFAEQGYSAARIDAIAKASGYNKSLIYQYYQDKLGLYTEVVKRADQRSEQMLGDVLESMMDDELLRNADRMKHFLEALIGKSYQYLLDNPRFLKIYAWEAAEGWRTWNQITYQPDDTTTFNELARKAQENGVLRAELDPFYFPIFIMHNVIHSVLSIQRFNAKANIPNDEQSVEHTKQQIARFVINGLLAPSHLR